MALDRVELAEVIPRLGGQWAVVGGMQLEKLAPGVGQATNFGDALGDALGDAGFVSGVVLTDELAALVSEEAPGVLFLQGLQATGFRDLQPAVTSCAS